MYLHVESFDGDFAVCVIGEQTYRGTDFAKGSVQFAASNGIRLESCDYPDWNPGTARLWVCGKYDTHDNVRIHIQNCWLSKIQAAIDEYNSWRGVEQSMSTIGLPNAWEVA